MSSTVVYIALGTNEGERWENLRMAVASLTPCVLVDRCSDVYETEPAYVLDQPRYLNMVIAGTTELAPYAPAALPQKPGTAPRSYGGTALGRTTNRPGYSDLWRPTDGAVGPDNPTRTYA